ncbi:MAG TPA: thioredoxin-disulfide reductase [bacterium]|nr:thioredoxin-disulfide reductase [bacterium]
MLYDLIIIGAGPAGISAAIYASRANLNFCIIDKIGYGGQIINTAKIENYPGFFEEISGAELISKMAKQAEKFGTKFITDEIIKIALSNDIINLNSSSNKIYSTKTLIIATGSSPKQLNVKGESEFYGKGVSYCATCDAPFFKNKIVAVIGGGDSALEESLYLTQFVNKLYLIHRRAEFRAAKILQKKVEENAKIILLKNSVVSEIKGKNFVESIIVKDINQNEEKEINVDGLFVFIGQKPNVEFIKELIKLNEQGFIITDTHLKTNIQNIFAAGDVRNTMLRQVVTAVADGAIAVTSVLKYLSEKN